MRIDVLAKRWLGTEGNDMFEYRRFPDCYWDMDRSSRQTWHGISDGWLAVAWMPIPPIPKEYP